MKKLFSILKKFIKLATSLYLTKSLLLFLNKVVISTEHKKIISTLDPLSTVIDIGANKGQFSWLVRILFPNAFIYAFEPLEKPFKVLSKVFKNQLNIVLFNYAIGHSDYETEMHVSKRDDSSSLLPITKTQINNFPSTEEIGKQNIKVKRLSDLIKAEVLIKPNLMKIDVQGYELEVLKGSTGILANINFIYVECSFIELYNGQAFAHEVINFLSEKNFNLIGIYNLHYAKNGIAVQGDFLFRNNLIT